MPQQKPDSIVSDLFYYYDIAYALIYFDYVVYYFPYTICRNTIYTRPLFFNRTTFNTTIKIRKIKHLLFKSCLSFQILKIGFQYYLSVYKHQNCIF